MGYVNLHLEELCSCGARFKYDGPAWTSADVFYTVFAPPHPGLQALQSFREAHLGCRLNRTEQFPEAGPRSGQNEEPPRGVHSPIPETELLPEPLERHP